MPARPARRWLRPASLAVAALALGAIGVQDCRGRAAERGRVLGELAAVGLPAESEAKRDALLREDDPARLRIHAARLLVAGELAAGEEGDPETHLARLRLARDLAAHALARQPAAWEAALFLGAATYLERARTGDPRLVTESAHWDRPLSRARKLAPTAGEPASFSAIAYLELWPALSEEKREEAVALLRRAFRDPGTFSRLMPVWLDLNDDADEALAVVPDEPFAWQSLERVFAERSDWPRLLEARARWREALEAHLTRRLAEAGTLRRHRLDEARHLYLAVVAEAPRERRFVPLVARALGEAPAGPAVPAYAAALRSWLEWSLDLVLAGRDVLEPALLDRLAGLAGDLPPHLPARASLLAGRVEAAEYQERLATGRTDLEAWGPYWILKARHLLARGHQEQAAAALARASPEWHGRPAYLVTAVEVAEALGDEALAAAAHRQLAATAGRLDVLRPLARTERGVRLELFADGPLEALAAEVGAAGRASLLEIHLDGALLGTVRARPGRAVALAATAGRGLHVVEVVAVSGDRIALDRLVAQERGAGGGAAEDGQGEGVGR
jgi:hypothetical protein